MFDRFVAAVGVKCATTALPLSLTPPHAANKRGRLLVKLNPLAVMHVKKGGTQLESVWFWNRHEEKKKNEKKKRKEKKRKEKRKKKKNMKNHA